MAKDSALDGAWSLNYLYHPMMRSLVFVSLLFTAPMALALVNGAPLLGHPDVVRIKSSQGWVCSGTYVDPYTILTAGHCVTEADKKAHQQQTITIESENDIALDVKWLKLIPSPLYRNQYWPTSDLGIIKTTRNKKFSGQFQLAEDNHGFFHQVHLYGCGRVEYQNKKYFRTTGLNTALRIGSVLFFLGETIHAKNQLGLKVSLAPNDSGGPIVDVFGKIIGVMTNTTLKDSANYNLPTLSMGPSTVATDNLKFIKDSMGPLGF